MSGMDYGKLERRRRFERGRREDALRPKNAIGSKRSIKQPEPPCTRCGSPAEAVVLLDAYSGNEPWLLDLQTKRRNDEAWRPSPRVAGIVIKHTSQAQRRR